MSQIKKWNVKGTNFVNECELCGTIGTKENEHSPCEWSFLRTHSWKLIKEELLK